MMHPKIRRCLDLNLSQNYERLLVKMAHELGRDLSPLEKKLVRRSFFVGSMTYELTMTEIGKKIRGQVI